MNDLLRNVKITEEELAAAYLAAFFNGKTTQSSIKDFLQLSNISSNVKLPTSFDGLVKVLTGEKPKFMHSKSWFCNICKKQVKKLTNRFQRECETCKSK